MLKQNNLNATLYLVEVYEKIPETGSTLMKNCNPDTYPKINVAQQILLGSQNVANALDIILSLCKESLR